MCLCGGEVYVWVGGWGGRERVGDVRLLRAYVNVCVW